MTCVSGFVVVVKVGALLIWWECLNIILCFYDRKMIFIEGVFFIYLVLSVGVVITLCQYFFEVSYNDNNIKVGTKPNKQNDLVSWFECVLIVMVGVAVTLSTRIFN